MSLRVVAVVLIAAVISLTGCGGDDGDDPVAVANPAAEYCVAQGGESLVATGADGSQTGLCRLPDGTVVDEWEFFRQDQGGSIDEPTPAEPEQPTAEPQPTATAEPEASDQPAATTEPEPTATAVPEPTTNPEGPVDFDVYLLVDGGECDEVVPRPRTSTVEGVLGDAMTQLLAGPTDDEIAEGLGSWFSADTAGLLRAIEIDDGVARISFATDLRTTIPNASSSCGSAGLLAQLDATATQFASVDEAVYSLDGDVDAFYEWLQLAAPE